jgi:hypothetical protein
MLRITFIGIMAIVIGSCSPVKNASKTSAVLTQTGADSTEYGITIIDPGFETWYLLNYSQAVDRTNEYYRVRNNMAVLNWNDYYRTGKFGNIIDCWIDFRSDVDYGIEVNRRLFWYFKYVTVTYRLNIF